MAILPPEPSNRGITTEPFIEYKALVPKGCSFLYRVFLDPKTELFHHGRICCRRDFQMYWERRGQRFGTLGLMGFLSDFQPIFEPKPYPNNKKMTSEVRATIQVYFMGFSVAPNVPYLKGQFRRYFSGQILDLSCRGFVRP